VGLISGRRFKAILDHFSPFAADGRLKPEAERVTLLAANANPPLELWGRAFIMAAAVGAGTPLILQLSYNALAMAGGNPKSVPTPEGVTPHFELSAATEGAAMAHLLLEGFARLYRAPAVGLSLDHFQVPAYREGGNVRHVDPYLLAVAAARIEDARRGMLETFGVVNLDEGTRNSYLAYLTSPEYQAFKRDFLNVVATTRPAWAMIDTEKLPPVLDFVVTREITEAVRRDLGNHDVIIEAEFGATGQSGEDSAQSEGQPLEGRGVYPQALGTHLTLSEGQEGSSHPGTHQVAGEEDKSQKQSPGEKKIPL